MELCATSAGKDGLIAYNGH